MKTILFLIGITSFAYGRAQNTSISDPNFEQVLVENGLDDVLDGTVLTANIDTVTSLWVVSMSINNLSGIEDFIMLKSLFCSQNQLTNLNVSQNPALEQLLCSSNLITNLNLTQNINLKYLHCDYNSLQSLDLSQNTELIVVKCESNNLTSIDISHCVNLVNLDCGANSLTSIDVSQNNVLRWLNCGTNQITSLNVSQNSLLENLVCHYNPIGNLNVTSNLLLNHLDCDSNNLTNLNVSQNIYLELLYCMDNQITELDVSSNHFLKRLACYNNQLTCLNIKNGNNTQMDYCGVFNNSNLFCIEVDDPIWSSTHWTTANDQIDSQMNFSSYCGNGCTTSLTELSIESKKLIKIVDLLGREIEHSTNTPMIYLFSDGSTKKVFEFNN